MAQFITKWDGGYYKVGQLLAITKWDGVYYKVGQLFLLQTGTGLITKWARYYKLGHVPMGQTSQWATNESFVKAIGGSKLCFSDSAENAIS